MPLPAMLMDWRPFSQFRVRGFVPSRLDAEYRVYDWWSVGLMATFTGDRYALSEQPNHQNLQVAFSTAQVGPRICLSPTDWIHFDLQVTAPILRRYDVYAEHEKVDGAALGIVPVYGFRFWFGPSMWTRPEPQEDTPEPESSPNASAQQAALSLAPAF